MTNFNSMIGNPLVLSSTTLNLTVVAESITEAEELLKSKAESLLDDSFMVAINKISIEETDDGFKFLGELVAAKKPEALAPLMEQQTNESLSESEALPEATPTKPPIVPDVFKGTALENMFKNVTGGFNG